MSGRIPHDAFQYYFGLGAERSYQKVADHFGVTKRAVTKRAVTEDWQQQVDTLEAQSRRQSERAALESMEAMNERHLKSLRVVQGKALEGLRAMPLATAMEAVRALDLAIRQERVVRGEPSERTAVSIEDVIRGEYQRWMAPEADSDE